MNQITSQSMPRKEANVAFRDPFQELEATNIEDNDQITIDEITTPDLVMITVARPDGRCVKRNVPRECWAETSYRKSLLTNLCTMLA